MKSHLAKYQQARNTIAIVLGACLSWPAMACPMCELGAAEAALFIVLTFGLFITGFATLFFLFWRKGGLKTSEALASRALSAEGIHQQEKTHEQ